MAPVKTDVALKLLHHIEDSKAELKRLGVIRSDRDPVGDFAEWWAAQQYDLRLAETGVQKGFDAVDRAACKYQIKARRVASLDDCTSFDFARMGQFDFLVIIFLERYSLRPIAAYKLPRDFALAHLKKGRFRWHREIRHELELAEYGPIDGGRDE
jgi:hypothetical protein